MGQVWLNPSRGLVDSVARSNGMCHTPDQFHSRMIRESRDLRGVFGAREITVRFKSYINTVRHALSDLAQACGKPVARFRPRGAGLDLVGKNANQWRTKFRR